MKQKAISFHHCSMKLSFIWAVYGIFILLALMSRPSMAFSYITLGDEGDLIEVSSLDTLNDSAPIVWSLNRISLAIDLEVADAPVKEGEGGENYAWNDAALVAMEKWNVAIPGFNWEQDAINNSGNICAATVSEDGINQIAWSDDYCGLGWGGDVLALTQITYLITETGNEINAEIIDTHILVNSNKRWSVYDGPLVYNALGEPIHDLQRVLLHELGHALGLTHPDENRQQVDSIMLSKENNLYNLTSDDIEGANTLYPMDSSGGGSLDYFLITCLILCLFYRRST